MSKNKKIVILIGLLLLLVAVGLGIYFGLMQLSEKVNTQTGGTLPTSPSGLGTGEQIIPGAGSLGEDPAYTDPDLTRLTQLTKGPVVDYFIVDPFILGEATTTPSSLQSAVFYLKENGDVVRVLSTGEENVYFSFGLTPLRLTQSPSGSFVLIQLLSGRFALLNVSKRVFEFLPEGTISATFSSDEKKLAYLLTDLSGKQSLFTRNLLSTKQETTKLFSLFVNDVSLVWPVGNRVYLLPPESFSAFQTIWYFDTISKTMGSFAGGNGIGAIFSPTTPNAIVFQNSNAITIDARVVNIKLDTDFPVSISTLRSKCAFVFDSDDVVCAAPRSISKTDSIVLPDDYNALAVFTNDYLYKLPATEKYSPQTIFSSTQASFDAIRLRARGEELFFVNRLDDSLYRFDYSQ